MPGRNKWQDAHKERRRVALNALKDLPCMDCDRKFPPYCMEFHHRDPKEKVSDVSHLFVGSYAWATILKEIEKCDLICVCCHRIRTFGGK